ncbi:hypothetical protein IWZ00DRAFT_554024 [Phyllosticta capitalensis]
MSSSTKGSARQLPRSTKAKRDDDIMQTNDSSIVSKRSVVELYHRDEPDFFRPFVGKSQRRSPLINRGYWLRMKAVEHTVKSFLEEDLDREKVVVNLGCGYDPLPFIILHKFPELVQKTTFVDVDYPPLMQKKRACINQAEDLKASFPFLQDWTVKDPEVWQAGQYLAVGCDLRQLSELERILNSVANAKDKAILFVAEVSVAYMDVKSADAVVSWASSFKDARFCILEQFLPDGADHPFASTMLRHFEKLHTHLKVVYEYPTPEAQTRRFVDFGWPIVKARTLWQLWGDDSFLTAEERMALDHIEPFDEWEEFALFAGHYILLVARTGPEPSKSATSTTARSEELEQQSPSWQLHLKPAPEGQQDPPLRRFGAACSLESVIIHHGGHGAQTRLPSFDEYCYISGEHLETATLEASLPLMCHTMTPLNATEVFIVGGRTSPNRAQDACYVVERGYEDGLIKDTLKAALPEPRYRHCAVPVSLGPGLGRRAKHGVLVFGGRTSSTEVLSSWLFWTADSGWIPVEVELDAGTSSSAPGPRFGASMYAVDDEGTKGVLMGGMSPDGLVLNDVWWWEFSFNKDENKCSIRCSSLRSGAANSEHNKLTLTRFGASVVKTEGGMLIVGGITREGILHWEDEAVLVTASRESLKVERVHMPPRAERRPLFIGTAITPLLDDYALLLGGGAVCFSMGSFWNTTPLLMSLWPAPAASATTPIPPPPAKTSIPRITITDAASFAALVRSSKPAIITGQSLGACVSNWTPRYLLETITPDRPVIIHSSPSSRMTFASKNFSYAKETFSAFLSRALSGDPVYLRSVASTQPAKRATHLATDFAALAGDFSLPAAIREVVDAAAGGLHSSPLRISGPVALWCHYDVLANVLCQIRGRKRLRLYAPADAKHLGYAAGASSSDVDVWYDDDDEQAWARRSPEDRERLARTSPWEGTLAPGEILFLPPMWSHAVKPETAGAPGEGDEEAGFSVAVNCFWRNLSSEAYAVGRDVYGNRDLAGYEEGRKAVEKIAKAFEGVPADLRGFYVDRLCEELREKVVIEADGHREEEVAEES